MMRLGLLSCVAPFVLTSCATGDDPPYVPAVVSATGLAPVAPAQPSATGISSSDSTSGGDGTSDSVGSSTTSQSDSTAQGSDTNGSSDSSNPSTSDVSSNDSSSNDSTSGPTNGSSLLLTSPAFEGSPTCTTQTLADCSLFPNDNISYDNNANQSPALAWTGVPEGTKSFAVTLRDSSYGQTLWVVWNIPAEATGLPANLPKDTALLTDPAGAEQSNASFAFESAGLGYFGPQAPCNVFTFDLLALSIPTFEPESKDSASEVETQLNELGDAILGRAKLAGRTKYDSTCEQ